jgi:hypothetical protein
LNPTTDVALRPNNAVVTSARDEFGARELQTSHETAASAVAAREKAATESRYIMAMQRPRNIEQFRADLLMACCRSTFAEKVEYAKPVGKEQDESGKWVPKYVYGPSIRFIETALQMYGNVYPEVATVYESAAARICRVSVTDLERNVTYTTEVTINKTVERKGQKSRKGGEWEPPPGRQVIDQRINSYGEPTYLVVATEDEVLVKQNALLSKALRTNAQRLLPYDIVEEAMQTAKATLARHDAENPDAAKRRIIDGFLKLGVQPVDIEQYLGKSLSKPLVPAEVADLREKWNALKDGETTWQAIIEAVSGGGSEELAEETRKRLIAEAEAKKAAQQQSQQQTSTDGNPASASGSGDNATSQATEKSTPGTPNASHEAAGSAPTTPSETKPAASRPTFGRRQS